MPYLIVLVAGLVVGTPVHAQALQQGGLPDEVAQVVRSFVAEDYEIVTDLAQVQVTRGTDPVTGRESYGFGVVAVAADGTEWTMSFSVDAARTYVARYHATADDLRLRGPEFSLSRDESAQIAWEFARARFPRPFQDMVLMFASEPLPPSTGRPPAFGFFWRARAGEAWTGDWVQVRVSPNTGDVLSFMCRPALAFTEDDVTIPRDDALRAIRAAVKEPGLVDLNEVTFKVELVLSHEPTESTRPPWPEAQHSCSH